jgi:hypothetical protein
VSQYPFPFCTVSILFLLRITSMIALAGNYNDSGLILSCLTSLADRMAVLSWGHPSVVSYDAYSCVSQVRSTEEVNAQIAAAAVPSRMSANVLAKNEQRRMQYEPKNFKCFVIHLPAHAASVRD